MNGVKMVNNILTLWGEEEGCLCERISKKNTTRLFR